MERVFTQTFTVVGAIIEQDGKILLVKEAAGHDKGKWNQPAGWVDPGENPFVAVKREIKEESGLDFEPQAVLGIYSIVKKRLEGKVAAGVPHGFKIIYTGSIRGETNTDYGDTVEARWFTPAEIEAMDQDTLRDQDIKQEVADYFAGKKYPLDLIHHTVQEKF
ncbi:MAG: NUDIX domain-containing protein [Candidatus Sungbacteria bacterium]|nr:NUDIX domain-containing protein [Candidatus Sungbacteria bacterium]